MATITLAEDSNNPVATYTARTNTLSMSKRLADLSPATYDVLEGAARDRCIWVSRVRPHDIERTEEASLE